MNHIIEVDYETPEYRAAQMHLHYVGFGPNNTAKFTNHGHNKTWKEYQAAVIRLREADAERKIYWKE